MKAILMSIKPRFVADILNEKKTIEIRKKFPSDYAGWVYIYCTINGGCIAKSESKYKYYQKGYTTKSGKVVARFWCNKVEQVFWRNPRDNEHIPYLKSCDLLKCACLCQDEFEEYVGDNESYAIHITKLEIFDKPKEIGEFRVYCYTHPLGIDVKIPLNRAPQSWQYIEI